MRVIKLGFVITILSVFVSVHGQEYIRGDELELSSPPAAGKKYIYEATKSILLQCDFGYSSQGNGEATMQIDRYGITTPGDDYIVDSSIDDAKSLVGALPGTLDVTASGGANYSVPIQMPEGLGGMKPNMAISYNNQSGNGLLGWAWTIAGMSEISRVGATNHFDGYNAPVSLDENRFSFDGKRLIWFCEVENEQYYKTECDDMNKIVSVDGTVSNPKRFEVWHPEGHIYEYGNNDDSRFNVKDGRTIVWLLNRIYDLDGNEIQYKYNIDYSKGEYFLDKILYSGNPTKGVQFEFSVEMTYEDNRVDNAFKFVDDQMIQNTKLLKKISICNNKTGKVLFEYSFKYSGVNNSLYGIYDRLTSIGFCSDGNRINDTKIIWNKKSKHYPQQYLSKQLNKTVFNKMPFVGDFDGDGFSDVAVVPYKNQDEYAQDVSIEVYLNNGDGTFEATPVSTIPAPKNLEWVYVADINSDDADDMIVMTSSIKNSDPDVTLTFYLNNGEGQFAFLSEYDYEWEIAVMVGDFFGKGQDDVITYDFNYKKNKYISGRYYDFDYERKSIQRTNLSKEFPTGNFLPADYNSDGSTELMFSDEGKSRIYRLKSRANLEFEEIFSTEEIVNTTQVFPGDFNGDGNADLLYFSQRIGWQLMFGTGASFTKNYPCYSNNTLGHVTLLPSDRYSFSLKDFSKPSIAIRVGDFDGDGTSDVAIIKNTGGNYYFQIGFKVFIKNDELIDFQYESRYYFPVSTKHQYIHLGNFFGRENLSFLCTVQQKPLESESPKVVSLNPHSSIYSVERIIDGLGNPIGLRYQYLMPDKLGNNEFYVKDKREYSNGIRAKSMPLRALRADTMYNVNGKAVVRDYRYRNALYHPKYKGFMGFEQQSTRTIIDNETRQKIEMVSEVETMDNNLMLLPKEQSVYAGEYQKISQTTFVHKPLRQFSNNKICKPVLAKEVKTKYDYDIPGKVLKTEVTENTYTGDMNNSLNYYFYHRLTNKKFGSNVGTAESVSDCEFQKTESMEFSDHNSIKYWAFNRILTKKTLQTLGESKVLGKCEHYSYDEENNLFRVKNIQIVPNTSDKKSDPLTMNISYDFDMVGNIVNQRITTGNGKETRSIGSEFSSEYGYRCPTVSQDLMGRKTLSKYDKNYGFIISRTDYNGQTTMCKQDPLGITTEETLPDGLKNIRALRWASEFDYAPGNASYCIWTKTTGENAKMSFYHKTGLELRTVTNDVFGNPLFVDKQYDQNGNLILETLPYRQGEDVYKTTYQYDIYNRPVQKREPNGMLIEYSYDGNTTTTRYIASDGTIQTQKRTVNSVGNIIKSVDNGGGVVKFEYNSDGTVATAQVSEKMKIQVEYDNNGNRTRLVEPNYGTITFEYDALGQLLRQKTPNGVETIFQYDSEGKLIYKTERNNATGEEHTTSWVYSNDEGSIGMLESIIYDDFNRVDYKYNELLYNIETVEIIDGEEFVTSYVYDKAGRVVQQTYPSGFSVKQEYTNAGYLRAIISAETGATLWQTKATNSWGFITRAKMGDDIEIQRSYSPSTGHVTTIQTQANGEMIQNLEYVYDDFNNLISREKKVGKPMVEEFSYDNQNRLIKIFLNGKRTCQMIYDRYGNIVEKSFGKEKVFYDADYSGEKPNAIKSASVSELVECQNRNIEYNTFDKVSKIFIGSDWLSVGYGFDQEKRVVKQSIDGNVITKYYVGNCEFEEDGEGKKIVYTYLQGPDGIFAVHTISPTGERKMNYVLRDNLGSWNVITDEAGFVEETLSFDAWGNLRDGGDWNADFEGAPRFDFGFTGHEHFFHFGVIDMKGRLYDPMMSMMLSPDNNIQIPDYSQNFNRYSYCLNNPLRYTDPTGEWVAEVVSGVFYGVVNLVTQYETGAIDDCLDGFVAFGAGFINGLTGGMITGSSSWVVNVVSSTVCNTLVANMNSFVVEYKGDGVIDNKDDMMKNVIKSLGENFVKASFAVPFKIDKIKYNSSLDDFFSDFPTMHHIMKTMSSHIVGNICCGENPFANFGLSGLGLDLTVMVPLMKDLLKFHHEVGLNIDDIVKTILENEEGKVAKKILGNLIKDLDLNQASGSKSGGNDVDEAISELISTPIRNALNATQSAIDKVRQSFLSLNYSLQQATRFQ